jgi:PAS domain S-box-containing protein
VNDLKGVSSALNSLAEGVVVADCNGSFRYFNPVAEKILGIGMQDIPLEDWSSAYGCYYSDQVTPYDSDQLPLARAIRGEEIVDEIMFIRNPERPEGIFISITANPLIDDDGEISGGTVVFRDITESLRTGVVLKESVQKVKAIFQNSPIPTFVWQLNGDDFVLSDYNLAAEVLTGRGTSKLVGTLLSIMYADKPEILADFHRCHSEKITFQREMNLQFRRSQSAREVIASYVFVPPDMVMVHVEDQTDTRRRDKENRQLFEAVEQTADNVLITDRKGHITYVNSAFETTTGHRRAEVLGKKPSILKSGMHPPEFYQQLWATILRGEFYRGTLVNKKKTGETYWCEQTITPMKDSNHEITHFVSVARDITERLERQKEKERLQVAREIQRRLYPNDLSVPEIEIAGESHSADETSGDYFDYFAMSDGAVYIILGDACGHGIGAALIMAQIRAFLHAYLDVESDPGSILTRLNAQLAAVLDPPHYMSLILVRLNLREGSLVYTNAGHPPAFLLRESGEIGQALDSTGVPLGFLHEQVYETSGKIHLAIGDTLVFLTDGILETLAEYDLNLGMERALDIVRRHQQDAPTVILDKLLESVMTLRQGGPSEDDITSIICHIKNIR